MFILWQGCYSVVAFGTMQQRGITLLSLHLHSLLESGANHKLSLHELMLMGS